MSCDPRKPYGLGVLALLLALGCGGPSSDDSGDGDFGKADGSGLSANGLGARFDASGKNIRFGVYSSRATRIDLYVYAQPFGAHEIATFSLKHNNTTDVFSTTVAVASLQAAGAGDTIYYGYRAWGPNWPFDPAWTKGSSAGFKSDVDGDGNRFNPNKLLLDPYAVEVSHDPINPRMTDGNVYASGQGRRDKDSGAVAPKAIVLPNGTANPGTRPTRPLKDEIIYEVHLRGLTMNDPSIPSELRGTYAGAARKAAYLRSLGVTAVEFLPVQETQNDQNDISIGTNGDNYWGYMTLAYFAPDRRYASDRKPGGPTREFQDLVRAMHEAGLKVIIDVVYNHTGEGALWDNTGDVVNVESFRGLDNPTYYEVMPGGRHYFDATGTGASFNTANDVVRNLVIDSLRYWNRFLGVDGFRFDLATVLGNTCLTGCFNFDKFPGKNALNRAVTELPVRPANGGVGVDLIAEPWAPTIGGYQLGNFPSGWAEWNGSFRDSFRKAQNRLGLDTVTPGMMAARIAGSSDLFADDGRRPWHSINFLVVHDGFTLRDLYSFNRKNNNQPWPFGPSDGGEDNNVSWDQGGDRALQRQAARTGLGLIFLSAGVPLITGGDEFYRTQNGNNNAYNLDAETNWLDWNGPTDNASFFAYANRLIHFRAAHPALRPAKFFRGADRDGNGVADLTWYRADGGIADGGYMDSTTDHFLAWRYDGGDAGETGLGSIYVAYNAWSGTVTATLPPNQSGMSWFRVADTAAWMESAGNFNDAGAEERVGGTTYDLAGRSLLLLIEK